MKSVEQILYYLNFILRNVVPCREVCNFSDREDIDKWISEKGYISKSSLLVRSLSGSDLPFESKDAPEFIIAVNPFDDHDDSEIQFRLKVIKMAKIGSLISTPTMEYSPSQHQKPSYSIEEWTGILSQLGSVVHVYDNAEWSLFLVLKHASNHQ